MMQRKQQGGCRGRLPLPLAPGRGWGCSDPWVIPSTATTREGLIVSRPSLCLDQSVEGGAGGGGTSPHPPSLAQALRTNNEPEQEIVFMCAPVRRAVRSPHPHPASQKLRC